MSNIALAITRLAFSVFSVSLMVHYLGTTTYGLVATITTMASWLALSQGGMGQSVRNEIIRLRATADAESVSTLFSTAFFVTLVLTGSLAILGTAVAWLLPWRAILNYPSFDRHSGEMALIICSCWMVLLCTPMTLVRVVYSALQIEYRLAPWMAVGLIASLGIIVLGVKWDLGILPLGTASLTANFVGLGLGLFALVRTVPDIKLSIGQVQVKTLFALIGPGLAFFVSETAVIIMFQSQVFIVNLILGQASVTVYSLHSQLFLYFQAAMGMISGPYWSAFGEAWHNGDLAWMNSAVRRLAIVTLCASGSFAALIIGFGKRLIQLWGHGQVQWDERLAAVLAATCVVQTVIAVFAIALGAMGVAKAPAGIVMIQAALSIGSCIWLTRRYGLLGVAFGAGFSYFATSGWYVPYKWYRCVRGHSTDLPTKA